jgi:hypothetical protein
MDHSKFLDAVYDDPDASYKVMEYADDLMWKCDETNDFEPCNDLLKQVDLSRCSITLALSFLTIFFMPRSKVTNYRYFHNRVRVYLADIDPDRMESLLRGLDP